MTDKERTYEEVAAERRATQLQRASVLAAGPPMADRPSAWRSLVCRTHVIYGDAVASPENFCGGTRFRLEAYGKDVEAECTICGTVWPIEELVNMTAETNGFERALGKVRPDNEAP